MEARELDLSSNPTFVFAIKNESHGDFLRRVAKEQDRLAARALVEKLTMHLIATTGRGLQLTAEDLSELDLSGFCLRFATLNRASLYGTNLTGADLSRVSMICPGLERTNFTEANLCGAYVHALAAQVCNFTRTNLSSLVDATGTLFHGSKFVGANFSGSVLSGAAFYQCDLTESDFSAVALQGAIFNECVLHRTSFLGALLDQATVLKSSLSETRFVEARGEGMQLQRLTCATGVAFERANFPALTVHGGVFRDIEANGLSAAGACFREVRFEQGSFAKCDLRGGQFFRCGAFELDLSESILDQSSAASCSFRRSNFSGVSGENAHFLECSFLNSSFDRFRGRSAVFRDCDATGVSFANAYLYRAMLTGDPPSGMSLRESDFSNAILVQAYIAADMSRANISGANLTYARLNQTIFRDANLSGISLYEASAVKVDFVGAQMAGVKSPFFAHRCAGLIPALEADGRSPASLVAFVAELDDALKKVGGSST